MAEFTVGAYTYTNVPLSAAKQFHLARKLAPVLAPFIEMALPFANRAAAGISKTELPGLLRDIAPVLKIMSDLPDGEVDYILALCLGTVSRKAANGGGWSPIWNKGAAMLMFDDLKMPEMLIITAHVIEDNLGDFMPAPLQTSSAA